MGNNEEKKPLKAENSSPPTPDQANIHVYPDWAAMQAYYGPRVSLPPYYNPAMASGHAPHPYMWGPAQHMLPPYGAPFAAVYSHGGVFAHPAVPIASHSNDHGFTSSPAASEAVVVTPVGVETPGKSSGNVDGGLTKKFKGFDGLAMSIGNGNVDSAEGGTDHGMSQSGETEGSTEGSDGHTAAAGRNGRKRSREGTPTDGKTETQSSPVLAAENNASPVAAAGGTGKLGGKVHSPNMGIVEVKNSQMGSASVPQACPVLPSEAWLQNERELKRERRKQSNRESARRSRLRKQAEAEELALKVETLGAENISLKSEINRLTENSEKLRLENAALLEKLKNATVGKTEEMLLDKVDNNDVAAISTENLLSRVSNSGSAIQNPEDEDIVYENNSKSGTKLHQLLATSPRADAVAAG